MSRETIKRAALGTAEAVKNLSKALRALSVSTREAARALSALVKALQK